MLKKNPSKNSLTVHIFYSIKKNKQTLHKNEHKPVFLRLIKLYECNLLIYKQTKNSSSYKKIKCK